MKIGQRIAYQQAKIILLTAFIIGGLSALGQFYVDMSHVRQTLLSSIDRSIRLYEPSLQEAIYNLDTDQAKSITYSLSQDPLFTTAMIVDDFGDWMASAQKPSVNITPDNLGLLAVWGFKLLAIPTQYERSITIHADEIRQAKIIVSLDAMHVSTGLVNRAITLLISGFIATVLLSLILFVIFYHVLSKPIQKISLWVDALESEKESLPPPYRQNNELGDLVRNVAHIWHKKDIANQKVSSLAYYDSLTELANRRLFIEKLEQALHSKNGCKGVVMYLDIDRFKGINDSLGHHVGDQLLVVIAKRLKGILPNTALISRFGGDEFVVMLPLMEASSCLDALATEWAEAILTTVALPLRIDRHLLHCSTSIGVTLFPQEGDTNSSPVLRRADTALYRTKENGRNGFSFFDVAMQQHVQTRWEIEDGLYAAINASEFEIWLQPQVSRIGIVTGAEVLLRWRHPEKGMIYPNDFISVAEETGQISAIEEWVLEEALRQLARWQAAGLPQTFRHLAINISPAHFMQVDFVDRMLAIIRKHPITGIDIEFEITESLIIENLKHATDTMIRLQNEGISISIDDFGTGYSSLRYIHQLPIDVLKIDRSFVSQIASDSEEAPIVDVILLMASKMKLQVIAEGVETQAQFDHFVMKGCQLFQGFYFSKPLHHRDFFHAIRQNDGKVFALN